MQRVDDNQKMATGDPGWRLLAEYTLNDIPFGKDRSADLTAGSLFQTMRNLSIPSECLKRIELTITETARGAKGHSNDSMPDIQVRICLFCHKETMDSMHNTEDQKNDGWGFYVIERGREFENAPYQDRSREVELYLYKEGE